MRVARHVSENGNSKQNGKEDKEEAGRSEIRTDNNTARAWMSFPANQFCSLEQSFKLHSHSQRNALIGLPTASMPSPVIASTVWSTQPGAFKFTLLSLISATL